MDNKIEVYIVSVRMEVGGDLVGPMIISERQKTILDWLIKHNALYDVKITRIEQ